MAAQGAVGIGEQGTDPGVPPKAVERCTSVADVRRSACSGSAVAGGAMAAARRRATR
ncbi:hypothetical protein GXW82_26355 [Streptacidiphilus sp. 4-A2]|nr:hypothetical protein [Streptacidiphilus sp. 4-A2]